MISADKSAATALSAERILALCGPAAREIVVETVASIGSTNTALLERLALLAPRHVLLAHEQTAGRGRAGRGWLSSAQDSLTFSLAWHFRRSMQELVGLPLAVGVAIAEALAHFQVEVTLKWPNDVLRGGKKLAGILIETSAPPDARDGGSWAVIGIGINVNMPAGLSDAIGRPAAQLSAQPVARDVLMAALLDELAVAMNLFDERGFAAFQARWNDLHAWTGQEVVMVDRGAIVQRGRAAGVDGIGRLLLDGPAGRTAVMAGDVSLRTLEDL